MRQEINRRISALTKSIDGSVQIRFTTPVSSVRVTGKLIGLDDRVDRADMEFAFIMTEILSLTRRRHCQ
jgi:hypothetical protein